MKRLALISVAALMVACGSSGEGDSRAGDGGFTPAEVDAACRAFCANEPEGSTCGPAAYPTTVSSIQDCYEKCTGGTGEVSCQSEWLSLLDCHLKLGCDDLFGDCDDLEDAWLQCASRPRPLCDDSPTSCFDPLFESEVLRTKLERCAGDPVAGGCHAGANRPTSMELDLTNPATTVESALSPLVGVRGVGGMLIDAECVGDSALLRKLTSDPGFGSRMPFDGDYWSNDEIECFRAYLHVAFMQAGQ